MTREVMLSPLGLPCNPPPWGQLHAIDMHTGKVIWEVPLGTTEDMAPFAQYLLGNIGVPNLGGPIVTAGGLVFIGATMDNYLRAFDAKNRQGIVEGPAARRRPGHAHDLYVEGPAICADRGRRPWKARHQTRRRDRGIRAAGN